MINRKDGTFPPRTSVAGSFHDMCYIKGREGDAEDLRRGFLVHGGGGVVRGLGGPRKPAGWDYHVLPAPFDKPRAREMFTLFGDGFSFLPVFGDDQVYLRQKGELVAVNRSALDKFINTRETKGNERDTLLRWRCPKLACGEPEWLVLAKGQTPAQATLITGGPMGISAMAARDGSVRWSVPLESAPQVPAIASGRIILTSTDGKVRCLGKK